MYGVGCIKPGCDHLDGQVMRKEIFCFFFLLLPAPSFPFGTLSSLPDSDPSLASLAGL
jgi:hypothetical protein